MTHFSKIAKVEDALDICMSGTKETADKLEIADKEAIDAELQVWRHYPCDY